MKLVALVGRAVIIAFLAVDAHADIAFTPSTGKSLPIIRIHGKISKEDVLQFGRTVEVAKHNAKAVGIYMIDRAPVFIALDSPGGSVNAAIAIGQAIRELNPVQVTVQTPSSCLSSCVLLLAGGVTRAVYGRVGIHRPYIDDDRAFTVAGQKQSYAEIEKNVKTYLNSVNVPTSLYDAMFRIPPAQVRFLTEQEMQEFNLNEDDPYYKEARDAEQAKKVGLSKSEYQRRYDACSKMTSEQVTNCFNRLLATPSK